VTGRLRNPPQLPAELDALIAAKTNLEATDNYPEIGAVIALTREADALYTALVDTSRYAQGLSQTTVHELNPNFFDAEQRRQWGIPEPIDA
jgi:hypothetical protein